MQSQLCRSLSGGEELFRNEVPASHLKRQLLQQRQMYEPLRRMGMNAHCYSFLVSITRKHRTLGKVTACQNSCP